MTPQVLIGSKRQLAEMLNLSERRITDLVTAKILPARGAKGFDLVASVRGYLAFLKAKTGSLTAERTRVAKLKGDLLELDLSERAGTLVKKDAVRQQTFIEARRTRDGVLNVPARISGLLAAESNQHVIHTLLTKELMQTLEGLSQ